LRNDNKYGGKRTDGIIIKVGWKFSDLEKEKEEIYCLGGVGKYYLFRTCTTSLNVIVGTHNT
jgi:hypothetical protein